MAKTTTEHVRVGQVIVSTGQGSKTTKSKPRHRATKNKDKNASNGWPSGHINGSGGHGNKNDANQATNKRLGGHNDDGAGVEE